MTTTCLIAALGTCIGIAAGLIGVGSSMLTVLLLVDVAGLPLGSAISTSLVVVAGTSVVALVPYSRSGAVMWRAGAGFGIASTVGAFVGGRVSALLPPRVLLAIFATTMAGAAIAMLWRPRGASGDGAGRSRPSALAAAAAGAPIGSLTGMVGLGGGFAVLPLLLVFTSASTRSAVGTTLFVVALNTLAGLAGHFPNAAVDWRLAGYVGTAASAGSLLGARFAERIDAGALKRVLGVLMLGTALVLVARALRVV